MGYTRCKLTPENWYVQMYVNTIIENIWNDQSILWPQFLKFTGIEKTDQYLSSRDSANFLTYVNNLL